MKFTQIAFALVSTLVLLCSCGDKEEIPTPAKRFDIDSVVRFTHHEQNIKIEFKMEDNTTTATVSNTAEWIENPTITNGATKCIIAHISENIGEERVATIELSAPGYANAKVKIKQNGTPTAPANHTLMFYFFGTSLSRYFTTNINDAKLAIESGALGDNNRVIYFRQSSKSEGYIGELCFDKQSGKCFESILESNIAINSDIITPEYITTTINRLSSLAPAQRYGLVLAGHGTAWIARGTAGISKAGVSHPLFVPAEGAETTRHFGESNVQVNTSELAEGILSSDIELDYILFDACFMSNIETIYELRNTANYIIASPCEIMGRGFPYERTLPHLFEDNGTTTNYDGAAKSYYLYYRDEYTSASRCGSIAVYDCSEVEALRNATKEVVKSAIEEYNAASLQTYEGQPHHYFYDFGEWANVVATDSSAIDAFNAQLNKTVIAKYTLDSFYTAYGSYGTRPINVQVYSGVTTSAPSETLNTHWKETEWYKSIWQL